MQTLDNNINTLPGDTVDSSQKVFYVVLTFILEGVAVQLLWGWFVVPILGLHPISFTAAIGLTLLANLWTQQYITRNEEETIKFYHFGIINSLATIVIGFFVHQFM